MNYYSEPNTHKNEKINVHIFNLFLFKYKKHKKSEIHVCDNIHEFIIKDYSKLDGDE